MLKNHPIPQALVERIYSTWLDFFNSELKHEFAFSKETQDGWFSTAISETAKGATQKDIKEYFHVYPWGRIPEQLKADALDYYAQANALAADSSTQKLLHIPAARLDPQAFLPRPGQTRAHQDFGNALAAQFLGHIGVMEIDPAIGK